MGGGVEEFFARLGPGWPLTGHQRRRLAPMAAAALETGWAPAALARFAGTNTIGVRSPYAVLAARLSPAELPAPTDRPRSRPPWCRAPDCDESTRRLRRADDGDGGRCPRCHPLAADSALAARGIPDVNAGARHGPASGGQQVACSDHADSDENGRLRPGGYLAEGLLAERLAGLAGGGVA